MSALPSQRIRVVIVDDEALALGILREWLAGHSDIDIVAECGNGFEAVKAATELKPDLLLLDVQMPKLDGFDVLELVGGDIPVIFITAYDSYAVRAFEVHAVDYAETLQRRAARRSARSRSCTHRRQGAGSFRGAGGRGAARPNTAAAASHPRARRSARHSGRQD